MPSKADWFNAVEVGDTSLVQQLLPKYKLSTNEAGDTALILAARLNKISIVRILAAHEHGKLTKDGRTALMIAASRDYPDICEILAPYEKDIYCDRGRDCLMIAAKSVSVESLSILLKYITYRRDNQDLCALDYAVLAESLVCVRLLLQKMTFQEEVLELSLSLARAKDLGAIETALKEALEHYHSFVSSQIDVKQGRVENKDGFKPAASATNILTADADHSQVLITSTRIANTSKIPRPDDILGTPGPPVSKSIGPESVTPGQGLQQTLQRSYYFAASQPQKTNETKSSIDGFSLLSDQTLSAPAPSTIKSFSPLSSFTAPQIKSHIEGSNYTPYVPYDFSALSDLNTLPPYSSSGAPLKTVNTDATNLLPARHDSSFNSFSEIERNLRLALSQIGTNTTGMSTPPSARTYQSVLEVINSPAVKTTKQLISAMAPMVNLINHQSTNPPGRLAMMSTLEDLEGTSSTSPLDAIESWKDVQRYITALEGHTFVKSKISTTPPLHNNTFSSPLLDLQGSKICEDTAILSALDAITSIKISPASRLADRLGTPIKSTNFQNKSMDASFKDIILDLPEEKKDKVGDFISRLYANFYTMESSQMNTMQDQDVNELEKLRNDYMLQKFEIGSQAGIIESLTTELEQLKQQLALAKASSAAPERVDSSCASTKQNAETQTDLGDAWFAAVKQNDLTYVKKNISVMARTKDSDQKTALMHAAERGYIDLAFILSEHEASIQQPDGFTALMHAVLSENYLIVKLLLEREAYYSTTQLSKWPAGCTALMLAAQYGNVQTINILLEKLCTERDSLGNTALYYAVTGGSVAALTALLSKSINFELHDIDAALTLAQEQSKAELINILQPLRQNKEANIQKYIRECSELRQRVAELEAMRLISGSSTQKQRTSSRQISDSTLGAPRRGFPTVPEGSSIEPGTMHEVPQRISEDNILSALQYVIENRRNSSLVSAPADESMTTATPSLFTPGFATMQPHSNRQDDSAFIVHANGIPPLHKEWDHIALDLSPAVKQITTNNTAQRPASAAVAVLQSTKPIDRRVSVINTTISPMPGPTITSEVVSPTVTTAIVRTVQQKQYDENSLFRAIANHDIASVKLHIDKFSRKQDETGFSPLMYAIQIGFTEAGLLLTNSSVGLVDGTGRTALMYCVEYGNIEIARALLSTEAGMQTKNMHPHPLYTALMFAVIRRRDAFVELLAPLESGKKNGDGETALMIAAKFDNCRAIRSLLRTEAEIMTDTGLMALAFALDAGNMQAVELLAPREAPAIGPPATHDGKNCTELMMAAELNDIVQVYALLDYQAKLHDRNGRTGLMVAAERGHLGIVRLLIPYEAKMQMTGRGWHNGTTALMLAASKGNAEVCSLLIPLEGRIQNKEGRTALMFAAWNGHFACVKMLKEIEARFTTSSAYELGEGFTALMAAATNGHEECVRLLMDAEIDITQPDNKGALYWANDNKIRDLLKNTS